MEYNFWLDSKIFSSRCYGYILCMTELDVLMIRIDALGFTLPVIIRTCIYTLSTRDANTVDSRYLEVEGTL